MRVSATSSSKVFLPGSHILDLMYFSMSSGRGMPAMPRSKAAVATAVDTCRQMTLLRLGPLHALKPGAAHCLLTTFGVHCQMLRDPSNRNLATKHYLSLAVYARIAQGSQVAQVGNAMMAASCFATRHSLTNSQVNDSAICCRKALPHHCASQ